ncbi:MULTISPECIES: HAD hydrolase family protein [unclassified Haladaptatus]|uniref:HAD family hydrolase n=1 Tax=unclassified Haladaptatus TaxID=2622732 RepID=UPI0023E7E8D0|nr:MULTISPECIES: HAD hydrolase family protein [unclassified Haladaptatus]
MERYDRLYDLYDRVDTATLRAYQEFVDLFPMVDSMVALEYWEEAQEELTDRKSKISETYPEGETFAEIAAYAEREQAFTALDLFNKYERGVNVLVLDVDETLRSAGETDNEIPRETLHVLTEFYERGVPIVICTGQTLENVKGFMIQGLGNELVHSGDFSIVYEGGTGVFTPGHGADTKQLLYEDLDAAITSVFDEVLTRVLPEAPERLRRGCHLQGNEFNVTLKPNYDIGSDQAVEIIDEALVYLLDLLGEATAGEAGSEWARAYYADADPEIHEVLAAHDALVERDPADAPAEVRETLDRIDVGYYEGDAVEIVSRELNKVTGVRAAFDVLSVDDPFALVMGDSKSDLRVMEWVADNDCGIAAAPEHASERVLDHVRQTDELVFPEGVAGDILWTVHALNRLAA